MLKISYTFSFSLDTKEKVLAKKARKVSPSTKNRNDLRRQKFLASKSKPSEDKEALEVPATDSVAEKPEVSCDECGHTTQTVNGMKLHVNNKHELSQVGVQKHFSLESFCTFSRLNEGFETELNRDRVRKF